MRQFILILSLSMPWALHAQSQKSLGLLPEITFSHSLSEKWKVTTQIESMQQGWIDPGPGDLARDYEYMRTDISLFADHKLTPLRSVAAGYLLRIAGGSAIHRTIQQFSWVKPLESLRIGHRLRSDQTFSSGEPGEFRFRYRLSAEIPLQGQTVNQREWYLIGSVEQLAKFQRSSRDLEQRFVAGPGLAFSNNLQLELGFDYRLDKWLNGDGRHRLWCTMSLYQRF